MCEEAGEFIYVMAYMYIAFLFVLVSIKLAKSYIVLVTVCVYVDII